MSASAFRPVNALLGIEIKFDIIFQRHKLPGDGRALGIFLEILSHLWGELVQMLQNVVGFAVFLDEFGGGFFADAGDSRDVVDRHRP